jgi:predicted GNAT superfamily acetyltransferase
MTALTLRDLSGLHDFSRAEALQRAVWGEDDLPDPYDLMMVIQAEGGLAAGAFQGDALVGYVFGFPTRERHIQHSHRLAVLPQAQGAGLGARLKWYQRDWCLARGITHVRWTFDPLRFANARLNIGQLGAEVTTYLPDYYGAMTGINAGTPSDRLMADWHLNAPHVVQRAAGTRPAWPDNATRIPIAPDFAAMLAQNPHAALQERMRVRNAIQAGMRCGLTIRDFDTATRSYIMV